MIPTCLNVKIGCSLHLGEVRPTAGELHGAGGESFLWKNGEKNLIRMTWDEQMGDFVDIGKVGERRDEEMGDKFTYSGLKQRVLALPEANDSESGWWTGRLVDDEFVVIVKSWRRLARRLTSSLMLAEISSVKGIKRNKAKAVTHKR